MSILLRSGPLVLTAASVLLLAGCETATQQLRKSLIGFNGEPLIQPQEGNCALDQLEAREEGFRLAGGVGGIAVLESARPTPVDLPAATSEAVMAIEGLGPFQEDVAILVLDDFHGVHDLDEPLFELGSADLDLDPGLSREAELEAKIDELVDNGVLSHGALVMNHVLALLQGAGASIEPDGPDAAKAILSEQAAVLVRAVDIEDFRTDLIADRLRAALTGLAVSEQVDRIAVNMSFAIVPCSVLEDYRGSGHPSFDAYIRELARDSGFAFLEEELLGIATTPIEGDPLQALTESEVEGTPLVVYVASAGNYALDYALAPAAWGNVIGVSSSDVGTSRRSSFSNSGEVMIDGAWFALTDPGGRNGGYEAAHGVVYAGTSFAAPAVAVYTALDLASQSPRCAPGPSTLTPWLAHGRAIDLPLAHAVLDRCP